MNKHSMVLLVSAERQTKIHVAIGDDPTDTSVAACGLMERGVGWMKALVEAELIDICAKCFAEAARIRGTVR